MKRKRPLPIPQKEFSFAPDTFNLFQQAGQDGERLARERDEADAARRLADAAQPRLLPPSPAPKRQSKITTAEYRLVPLHDALPPGQMAMGDTPERIADYWRAHVQTSPTFAPTVENAVLVMLNTRRRITGHFHLSTGTLDTCFIHPREIFRTVILSGASAFILTHNHPTGEATPSEGDIKVTRDILRAGQLLKIELLDHVIVGHPAEGKGFCSLRELGYLSA